MVEKSTKGLSEKEIRIIICFLPFLDSYTTKEIEEKSKYSHERVYTILMSLVNKNYLVKRKTGKTYLFSVNKNKDILLPYVHFHIKRTEKFLELKPVFLKNMLSEFIKKIYNDNLISVVLFGSYAKGKERKSSDIDILCVARRKYNIEKVALSLEYKYNKKVTPIVILSKDFENMKKDNPAFYKDLIESGIILYGIESFYRLWKN